MERDVKWYDYFKDNHRYADIINGVGCNGQQIVSHEDLTELDTRSKSKSRDLVCKAALGVNFAIIGIENQDVVDYELPVRMMEYDATRYRQQVSAISKRIRKNKEKVNSGEYLYGFKKEDKLYPVVTFILYAGKEVWDGSLCLHDIIDFTDIPEALVELVQDYNIKVIDIRRLEDTSVFQTDVRQVFDFIRCAEDWNALLNLVNGDSYYQKMDEEAYEVVSKYANLNEGVIKMDDYKREDGGVNVCKGILDLMENSKAEGRNLGREEGIKEGIKEGRTEGIEQGERLLAQLVQLLLKSDRIQEIDKATTNKEYREQLYKEFKLV